MATSSTGCCQRGPIACRLPVVATLDAYIRVSALAGRSGDSFHSPEDQERAIVDYAQRHGHTVAAVHRDLDRSGGNLERPGFAEMMRRIRTGETEGVLAAKLDRVTRSAIDGLKLAEELDELGAHLVIASQRIDTTTPEGRMMFGIILMFAQLERDRHSEAWALRKADSIEHGIQLARAPAGYARDPATKRLVPNGDAEAVREAFDRRAGGHSITAVARYLTERQVTTSEGSTRWSTPGTKRLLASRTYLGEVASGAHRKIGAHEPIVTRATFEACQRQPTAGGGHSTGRYLLSGLLRCSGCGMAAKGTGSGKRPDRYRCKRQHSGGPCTAPAEISAARADEYVTAELLDRLAHQAAEVVADTAAIGKLERALADAEYELADYAADTEARAALGATAFAHGATERRHRIEQLSDELAAVRRAAGPELPPISAAEAWSAASQDQRRDILRAAIDAVFLYRGQRGDIRDRIEIVWAGELDPSDRPRHGKVWTPKPRERPSAAR